MADNIDRWNINGVYYDIHDRGRGLPNGVATLDENGRIPFQQLPESALEYKGLWNAETNTPTIADGTGDAGDMWIVAQSGRQNLGHGEVKYYIGDRIVYDGTVWQRLPAGGVYSVNGKEGDVVLYGTDIALTEDTTKTIKDVLTNNVTGTLSGTTLYLTIHPNGV